MRKLFAFIVIILLSIGCGESRPADVLPKDKMKDVMWDMLKTSEFLDAFVLYKGDSTMDRAATITAWYNKVYQLHNVTKAQFDKSYAWYQDRPKLMKEMLDSLSKLNLPVADSSSKTNNTLTDSLDGAKPTIQLPSSLTDTAKALPRKRIMLDSLRRTREMKPRDRID